MREYLSLVLCLSLIFSPLNLYAQKLEDLTQKSYLELLDGRYQISKSDGDKLLVHLRDSRDASIKKDKEIEKNIDYQINELQNQLKHSQDKTKLHCQIIELGRQKLAAKKDIYIAETHYANEEAKIELLENFVTDISSRTVPDYGDVRDIGVRKGFEGQEKDIRWGEQIVTEAKREGAIKPEVLETAQQHMNIARAQILFVEQRQAGSNPLDFSSANSQYLDSLRLLWLEAETRYWLAQKELAYAQFITDYINNITQNVAAHSDVKVPVHMHLIYDDDVNAFALPGGIIYIQTGLINGQYKGIPLGADSESEFAGVIGHELGHVAARHAHKLQKKADIIGGIVEVGFTALFLLFPPTTYAGLYLWQLYEQGLAFLIDLKLLGVSRAYEAQADLLGTEYEWSAGYNPKGLINFEDKMANATGYVESGSWYRTHPPSYIRILNQYLELKNLPEKSGLIDDTKDFHTVKQMLTNLQEIQKYEDSISTLGRPSMLPPVVQCP